MKVAEIKCKKVSIGKEFDDNVRSTLGTKNVTIVGFCLMLDLLL